MIAVRPLVSALTGSKDAYVTFLGAVERAAEPIETLTALHEAVALARSPLGADPAVLDPYERAMLLTGGRLVELERIARGLPSRMCNPGRMATDGAPVDHGGDSEAGQDEKGSGEFRDAGRAATASRREGVPRAGCRGGCATVREDYAREFWRPTDLKGGRATQEEVARSLNVSERSLQRYLAGCPAPNGSPRHAPLPWPPRPDQSQA
jgi:hypothetical protein